MLLSSIPPDKGSAVVQNMLAQNPTAQSYLNTSNASAITDFDDSFALYAANREWAEQQAQRQMDFQTSANRIAMDFSAAEAAKQRAYETVMSNTAYQRAVEDLKKAGLNPALAYQQGGASVPSVSAASGITSSGAMAAMVDSGYTPYEIGSREGIAKSEIRSKEKIAAINAAISVLNTAINSATQIGLSSGGSTTGKIGF